MSEQAMTIPEQAVELLPCPFCGRPPKEIEFVDYDLPACQRLGIKCESCGAGFEGPQDSRVATVERWNKRAALPLVGVNRTWQPMSSEPNDGKFRFYGLHINHDGLGQVFEAHYIALDDDGQLILPGGDNFDDWHFTDFEVWCDAPPTPAAPLVADNGTKP